ncbi:MAG: lysophospholipid acyltransferase family protein [Cyanobacteria bacterium P01_F01_bin.42]
MNLASLPLSELGDAIAASLKILQNTMADSEHAWDGTRLQDRSPETIQDLLPLWGWFYQNYFPVTIDGLENIPEEQILMVGSHNGGLAAPDMFMLMWAWFQQFGTERPAYGLMNAKMWTGYPAIARVAAQTGAVRANPKMAIAALQSGASVLVYPGGARDVFRPHTLKHRIFLNGNLAFIKLALREQVPIVPVVSLGAHETLKVVGDLYPWMQKLNQLGVPWLLNVDPEVWPVFLGLPWGIGVGPLLNIPLARPIHLRIGPAITLPGDPKSAKDPDHVIACYDRVYRQMQSQLDELVAQETGG